uniref:Somatostatin receptor 3 n=1 Tax=Anolis carolinensis TaxID=28377 RepID=G1KS46_ANOCA|nr:PREDICTED: somatostatin receptor type 3 [Anolis carolinensis]XP_008108874.1 PREDICTED: somatostatin receptor type 3 [Anolis carolinensis]XP_008108875.1 PREDICTED: somatostatin receptor type 3 [Anolis carolinensis]|eukprot:XP_003221009.1 PREDICTED: somatostatin receptor type 3 [Anolis carolinensis]
MDNFNFTTTLSSWEENTTISVSENISRATALGVDVSGVLIPIVYLIVCVVGLAGNSLVIYVVLCHSVSESVTNVYIFNLALADELFMLGLPFLAAQNALSYWPFGSFMCRLVMAVDATNQFTSIFCLTVMSVDRYLAVVHPVKSSKWRTARVAKAVSATVWVLSSIVVLPVLVFSEVPQGMNTCHIKWPEPAAVWQTGFIIYTATLGFFGPLLVICLCYLLIVVKVRSSGRKVRAVTAKRKLSEQRVTHMVVAVVAVFVLCWLPFYVLNIINVIWTLPEEPSLFGIYFLVVVLPYANSCANPIIYGFLSYRFKQGFRRALLRPSRRVQSQDATATAADKMEKEEEEEEEEEGEEEEMEAEASEICKIAQNGNGRQECRSISGSGRGSEQKQLPEEPVSCEKPSITSISYL